MDQAKARGNARDTGVVPGCHLTELNSTTAEEVKMSATILISPGITDKKEKYETLIPQIRALVEGEEDVIANLANIMAALKYGMDFFWVGIYLVKNNELVLGPFQGPVACVRIARGRGVCGTSWQKKESPSRVCLPVYVGWARENAKGLVLLLMNWCAQEK